MLLLSHAVVSRGTTIASQSLSGCPLLVAHQSDLTCRRDGEASEPSARIAGWRAGNRLMAAVMPTEPHLRLQDPTRGLAGLGFLSEVTPFSVGPKHRGV
jgi:hypothetical protein